MFNALKTLDAFNALILKYPNGISDVQSLSEEQRAWVELKIQVIAQGVCVPEVVVQLRSFFNRLSTSTEDIPCQELQRMASFVFGHKDEILRLLRV